MGGGGGGRAHHIQLHCYNLISCKVLQFLSIFNVPTTAYKDNLWEERQAEGVAVGREYGSWRLGVKGVENHNVLLPWTDGDLLPSYSLK